MALFSSLNFAIRYPPVDECEVVWLVHRRLERLGVVALVARESD